MQAAFPARDAQIAAPLFSSYRELRGILYAGLHGMGRLWLDAPLKPRAAVLTCGDFLLCGGQPGPSARHLLRVALGTDRRDWLVRCPGAWKDALSAVTSYETQSRWAFDHDVQPRDEHLLGILRGRTDLTAVPLSGEAIAWCRQNEWSRDFVSVFANDDAFTSGGLGVLISRDGAFVAGASSYVAYPGGIELQVQTRDDCQGLGYATYAAAALILEAHRRGLKATWDAANPTSVHIAQKLGYRCLGEYEIAQCTKPALSSL